MIGTKLAHYEITSHLGSGGMGDVYEATDSKLGRSVAIKFLPEAFNHDIERVGRFEREARVLASLNHSNIAAIYGLEQSATQNFLVMELVEGETLADRIKRGPIPVEESLGIAKQICEALESAHEKGIVHRDLKPANVKVTPDGKVKVLDFGLAKAFEFETSNAPLSNSPTLSMAATNAGVILGTAAYMSPEQAKGRTVDRRTDIFSFGCLLYEMLTGQPPFTGDSIAEIIGALQYKEPDWSLLPDATPAYVRGILRRCLQKDKTKRLASAGDIAIQIQDAGSYSDLFATQTGISAPLLAGNASRWRGKLALGAAVFAALFIGSAAAWFLKPTASLSPPALQLAVPLPLGDQLVGQGSSSALGSPSIALSPDGKLLVYGAVREGTQMLYLRRLDSNEAKPIPGTDGGYEPFFAPDGKRIGFFSQGKLKKTTLTGASAETLCDAPAPAGGSWGPDETIVFAPFYSSGLWLVSVNGGEPKEIAAIDRSRGELGYLWPHYLPGGREILFGVLTGSGWDMAQLSIFTLATGERRTLLQGAVHGWFVPPDNLGYVHGGTLLKVPVDPRNWKVSSTSPVSIAEDVMYSGVPGGFNFAFSESGALAYVAAPGQFRRRLVWKDRKGNVDPIPGSVGALWAAVLSPDEKKAALTVEGNIRDVWVYDLDRGTMNRITTESGGSMWPQWSPDGKRIVYRGNRSGHRNLFWRLADGTGGEEQLTTGEFMQSPGAFSPDGKVLAFWENTPSTSSDLWLAFPQGADVGKKTGTSFKPRLFRGTRFSEAYAAFSPDGRWIAYVSNESGRDEVYVVPFPGPGGRLQVSTGGGINPRWSQNGREIIYLNDNQLMAVAVTINPTFRASRPTALFSAFGLGPTMPFDVSADGQRFLMTEAAIPEQPPTHINLVLNWLEGLKQRVPVP